MNGEDIEEDDWELEAEASEDERRSGWMPVGAFEVVDTELLLGIVLAGTVEVGGVDVILFLFCKAAI